jgi:hypothetical protein
MYKYKGIYPEKTENFPQDDELSIQQGCGTANLNIFYGSQFYQDEQHPHDGSYEQCSYWLIHTPICPGTLTGTLWLPSAGGWMPTQNFLATSEGVLILDNSLNLIKVNHGFLDMLTGELNLEFNTIPGVHKVVVSYYTPRGPSEDTDKMLSTMPMQMLPPNTKNSTSYTDYLISQLSDTKSKLVDAETKLDNLEVKMYDEYEKKIKDMKEYIVGKIDQFLKLNDSKNKTSAEIFEEAVPEDALPYKD